MNFHLDDDETASDVLERVKQYKIVKLFERYVKVYNKTNKTGTATAKHEFKTFQKDSIIMGI
jgi:hypothetical protein